MNGLSSRLFANYQWVMDEIAAACERAGRKASDVTVTAVTKTVSAEVLPVLYDVGLRNFAENRLQQAREKLAIPLPGDVTWHFIGRLQSNKVKDVVSRFDVIHSVDSVDLARHISAAAKKSAKTVNCFLQVNISGEETKTGISPEEALQFLREVKTFPNVQWVGLMTMAPRAEAEGLESVRPIFRRLRELRDALQVEHPLLYELSMGMSEDFPVAVEEGATFVRIGRRLVNTELPLGDNV